ncbi:class I adenylate-forming enzyme family protein [Ramlibacter sp.]|uniref:class I adenylate-forming enzyme family protein n=1 Tax=Ramlibacter sp. TaxID=1917967 RepID=UPI002FC77784
MAVSKPQEAALFTQVLRSPPGKGTALLFNGRGVTFADLQAAADAAAAVAWHAWGVRPGDRVAWLGANDPAQLALLFGLARIGAALLPLNFRLAPAELQRVLADCTPRHLVHDAEWAGAAADLARACGVVAHPLEALAQQGLPAAPDHAAPDAPVLLVCTSGTTGGPKAAVHTQRNLLANMAIAASVQEIDASDTVLTVLPLFHVGGLCIQTLPALWAGARVILHRRFHPGDTLACIAADRPTLTLQVPATMKALVDHPQWETTDFSSLRAVWAGSSLLPAALIDRFHARGLPVCNVYGATETGPFSIALPPPRAMDHVGSCGWPAPGVEARQGTAHGDAAELLLRGPNVVARYWPDLPARDADGWFATGDLAQQAADGSWRIVGRARDLIISGGENVHPAEIELALADHPAVAECAAFGVPDAQWGEVVAMAVVLHAGATATPDELGAHLAQRVARFKLPRRWLFRASLPKTALGKVQRAQLARDL